MPVVEVVGWSGSALLVVSLLQTRVMRFRVLNAIASVVLVGYNVVIEVWPMVALNVVLVVINLWVIAGLVRRRHDARSYAAVPIGVDEPFLDHLLRRHARDIAALNPDLPAHLADAADHAFLVSTGDQLVGVVLSRDGDTPGEQVLVLDHVLPAYRDFTPGEFVFRPDGPFAALGARRVVAPPATRESERYRRAVGFRPAGDREVLEATPAP